MIQTQEYLGVKHYYEICGEGEWLVLIHGWAGSTMMWKRDIEYLSKRFKVLNYDLRGHAQTGATDLDKYSLKLVADDLAILMDELGIEKAHLCSLSLGTIVAQGFQLYHPNRVMSHVIIGPPGKYTGLTKVIMKVFDKFIGPVFGYRKLLEGLAYTVMPTPAEKISRKFFIAESKKLPTEEIRKWWQIIVNDNFYENMIPIFVPTLILIGAGDWFFIKESSILDQYFVNCKIHIVPNTGHVVSLQNPQECQKQIQDFYSGLGVEERRVEGYINDKAVNE